MSDKIQEFLVTRSCWFGRFSCIGLIRRCRICVRAGVPNPAPCRKNASRTCSAVIGFSMHGRLFSNLWMWAENCDPAKKKIQRRRKTLPRRSCSPFSFLRWCLHHTCRKGGYAVAACLTTGSRCTLGWANSVTEAALTARELVAPN